MEIVSLPDTIVKSIKHFILQKNIFSEMLIKDSIFEILEKYCIVLYYPQRDEDNDGCHVKRLLSNVEKNFVYINTYKPIEKQIFTAAHELGHILELDSYLKEECAKEYTFDMEEAVMNKFAAMLLMPDDIFIQQIETHLRTFSNGRTITIDSFIKFSIFLMNYFFVPFKAVVIRLYEINFLKKGDAEKIMTDKEILDRINDYIKVLGYKRLGIRSKKKSIKGFAEILDDAEKKDVFSTDKFNAIRLKMDIPIINSKKLNNKINISELKTEKVNAVPPRTCGC